MKIGTVAVLLIMPSTAFAVTVALAEEPLVIEYYFDLTCETCGKYEMYLACNETVRAIEGEYGRQIRVEWLSIAERENLLRFREYDVLVLPVLVFDGDFILGGDDITLMSVKITVDGYLSNSGPNPAVDPTRMTVSFVIVSGLLDGVNPCAIALLVFFLSFLFGIHRTRRSMYKLGSLYILSLYLTYLAIGLGLLQAITIFGVERLFARIASILLVVMGLISLKDSVSFERPLLKFYWPERLRGLVERATTLVAVAGGVLVGLGEFPCSGSIYVGVLAFISSTSDHIEGLLYLLLYNLMFVMPLILILVSAYNIQNLARIDTWRVKRRRQMRLVSGVFLISLSLITWFWLVG